MKLILYGHMKFKDDRVPLIMQSVKTGSPDTIIKILKISDFILCRSVKGTQHLCDFLWALLLPDNATIQLYYKQLLNNVENLH